MGCCEVLRIAFSVINALCTPVLIAAIYGVNMGYLYDVPRFVLLYVVALFINVHLNMLALERTFKTNRRLIITCASYSIFLIFLQLLKLNLVIVFIFFIQFINFLILCYFVISFIIVCLIHWDFRKNQNTAIDTELNTIETSPE
ncbi:uncharacterized protein LOC132793447 [Drosophila nasuta]|uniref:uncharacterized protein LOC132793447 n=1 Tax=Drosophila nasuta TaxID=42062 RepID=UPI00295F08CF|nr:uncharacterized protein LOC132793447 [Drosophila nasuta]